MAFNCFIRLLIRQTAKTTCKAYSKLTPCLQWLLLCSIELNQLVICDLNARLQLVICAESVMIFFPHLRFDIYYQPYVHSADYTTMLVVVGYV